MKQRFKPDQRALQLMEPFRLMTNDCIRIGLAERVVTLKVDADQSTSKLRKWADKLTEPIKS